MDLPGLDEPVGLRARAATDPDAVQAAIASGRLVVAPVWKAWGPALAAQGVDRAALSAVLRSYGYELWLWAAGERTWAQFLEGLAGRVSRRAGARVDGRAPRRTAKASKAGKPTKSAGRATKTTGRATKAGKTRSATKVGRPSKAGKTGAATKARKAKATKVAKTTNVAKTRLATKAGSKATPTKAAKKTRRR